jgi:hypothetical protein
VAARSPEKATRLCAQQRKLREAPRRVSYEPGIYSGDIRQRPTAATVSKGCFWGYPNATEMKNPMNSRCFLRDFESVPGSHFSRARRCSPMAQQHAVHLPSAPGLLQQGIVAQTSLADGQEICGSPIGVNLLREFGIKHRRQTRGYIGALGTGPSMTQGGKALHKRGADDRLAKHHILRGSATRAANRTNNLAVLD